MLAGFSPVLGMKQYVLFIAGLLALAGPARAQAPAWQTAVLAGNGVSTVGITFVKATAADAAGNVYVAGTLEGTVSFSGITLTSAGSSDGFVAKWNRTSGTFVWAQRLGGGGQDDVTALAVSGTAVYLTGYFNATAIFGSTLLTSAGFTDMFVAKLTDAGLSASFTWAARGGGGGFDQGNAIALSGISVYVSGYFSNSASFGTTNLTSAGGTDAFVAKYGDAGTAVSFAWALRGGGPNEDSASALAVSGNSVYAAGFFVGAATFGSTALNTFNNTSAFFVTKLADAGATAGFTWTQQGASTSGNVVTGLAVSGANVYVAGSFNGALGLGSVVLTSAGLTDVFVAKLADAGATSNFGWAQRAGGAGLDRAVALVANGGTLYCNGNFAGVVAFGSTTLSAVGGTNADVFVTRLTDAGSSGSFNWAQQAGGPSYDYGQALALASTGTLYVGGYVTPPAAFGSLTLASPFGSSTGFLASLQVTPLAAAEPVLPAAFTLFPNPVATGGTVRVPGATAATELLLLDALGQTVTRGTGNALGLTGVAPGLYGLRATETGSPARVARLLVE